MGNIRRRAPAEGASATAPSTPAAAAAVAATATASTQARGTGQEPRGEALPLGGPESAASVAYDLLFKLIIVGESGTGKSCLLHTFVHNAFRSRVQHTVGVEFASKLIPLTLTSRRGGSSAKTKIIKLQMWDTAGQERFRAVTRSYFRGAAGALLVYDITRRSTFDHLDRWLSSIRELASPHAVIVLVGNKLDQDARDRRQVPFLEAAEWADQQGLLFLETSALSGENVETPFTYAAHAILHQIDTGVADPAAPASGISYGERGRTRSLASRWSLGWWGGGAAPQDDSEEEDGSGIPPSLSELGFDSDGISLASSSAGVRRRARSGCCS